MAILDTIEFIFTEGGLATFLSQFGTDMYTLRGGLGCQKIVKSPVKCLQLYSNYMRLSTIYKSDNLQYNTVRQWVDGTIALQSYVQIFILKDWD